MNFRNVLLIICFLGIVPTLQSQETKSVVYLHSGRIISGTIIELIPNEFVRIAVDDRTVRTIPFSEIASIRTERMAYHEKPNGKSGESARWSITLYAGGSFSGDEFSLTGNSRAGYAASGYLIGGEVSFPVYRSFLVNMTVAASRNAVDDQALRLSGIPYSSEMTTTPWIVLWTLPGISWRTSLESVTLSASLNYGWQHVQTPSIVLTGQFAKNSAHSFQARSAAFGYSVEALLFDHLSIAFRYFTAAPSIPLTVMSNPEYMKPTENPILVPKDITYRQPITIYGITAGISF